MGVTEPWMVTTEGQKNWTAACEREIQARFNWNDKWGWMPGVMAETIDKLKELKGKQIARIQEMEASSKEAHVKNPRPLPKSVNHEYGWLATRPDFQLERFGPFPLTSKVRVEPTMDEIDEEVSAQDLSRAKRALEKKKKALEKAMAEQAAKDGKSSSSASREMQEKDESPRQHLNLLQRDAKRAETAEDTPSSVIKDPGHVVASVGGKKKYCCCTANCACLKINRVRQNKLSNAL